MATRTVFVLSVLILLLSVSVVPGDSESTQPFDPTDSDTLDRSFAPSQTGVDDYYRFSKGNFTGTQFSSLNLSVRLDDVQSTVIGNLTLDYYNDEPVSFTSLPFHLYPIGMLFDTRQGNIQILNVTTAGTSPQVLSHSIEPSGQVMWVDLPASVGPGERTSLRISFVTTLPDGLDRANSQGLDSAQARIYTFASCYPMPCVYDELDGWNTDLYVDYGDPFYLDMAFYDFFVEVPTDMVVAATGELIESGNDGMNVTYHFSAGLPVREVTFSASRYYQVETIMVGHVNVTSYYLPDSQPEWGDNVIQWSNRTLRLLNHTYGIYPYSTLNVVEQHAFYGGMEYPCQVYVTHGVITLMRAGQRASWYLQLVVVHEVAHQWWSQLVGGDAIDWGFLDEGLTCWSHSYYGEYYHSNWEYFQYDRYLDVSRPFYNDNGIESAINQSNYDRPELTGYIDYIKTPLVLERLRVEIGHEAFVAGLSHFFKKCYFRIGTLSALQDSMEGAFGGSLDWFFLPFFDNPRFPDYWFSNVVYNYPDSTLSLTIEDRNQDSNPYPFAQRVPLRVWGTGYQQIPSHIIFEDTVWINGTTNLILPLTGEPDEVMLIYGDYVLVELTDAGTVSLATQDIQVVGYVDPFLIYQLIVVALVGIVAIAAVGSFLRSRRT